MTPGSAAEAERLEAEAERAYVEGNFEASVASWEALHDLLARVGDRGGAARAAAMTAMFLLIDSGLMAPIRAWLRRAGELLEGEPEQAAHALIATVHTYERFMSGDAAASRALASEAIELGERHGVVPAVVIGRTAAARLTILDGDVTAGVEQLDDVAAMLIAGHVDALTTGMMYCELVCAAQGLGLLDRAAEWTAVMERWRRRAAFGGLHGRCRVHRAELLRVSGPCDEAEQEAIKACEELRPWMRREFGWPLVELGTIRLRKGDLVGAEQAFLAAHARAWSAQPGLSLLRLAQGDAAAAADLIAHAIEHPFDVPSKERPPIGELRLAPLLDAQVEIAVATGDASVASRAADALHAIAERFPSPGLAASSMLGRARAALVSGRFEEAIDGSTLAAAAWTEIGAPFEAAAARVVLAEAFRRSGHVDRARVEWAAAQQAFDEFGAVGWRDRVAAFLDEDGEPTPAATDDGPACCVEGGLRVVTFGGHRVVLRDLTGFRYLERLLAAPGRELHVLDLVGELHAGPAPREQGLLILDDQARAAYRRRLADIDDDIDDATRMNDPVRKAHAEADRSYLVAELARAVGLGGRARTTGASAERARTSVARSLRYALGVLAKHHPAAAEHLQRGLRTGTYCSYLADPIHPVTWTVTRAAE